MPTATRLLRALPILLVSCACAGAPAPAAGADPRAAREGAAACLDQLHHLAGVPDGAAYFELFTPDAVYLGTDAGERWTIAQFRAYAEPYFSQGRGWTYLVTERHLGVSADGRTVWFDERLDNASYGECRGSGVLVWRDGRWRIAQYVLSLPVPNDLAGDLVERIRALEPASGAETPDGGL